MPWTRELWGRVRSLWRRKALEGGLDEEVRFHIEAQTDKNLRSGMTPVEARRQALLKFGPIEGIKDSSRDEFRPAFLEETMRDIRYGARALRRAPGFTAVASLTLALGIGANTAIYSFMDAILLRSLPVPDPASLVVINWRSQPLAPGFRDFVMRSMDGRTYRDPSGVTAGIFPFPAFEHMQQTSTSVLSTVFAYQPAGSLNVIVEGAAEMTDGEYVSGEFFRGLGVSPAAGRLLLVQDDRAGAAPVVVLSFPYSQRRFGGPTHATGQPILINNVAFTVVGVAPPEFFGVDPGAARDVYLPMQTKLLFDSGSIAFLDQNYYWVQMMGRLRPGISREQAQAVLKTPFAQWVASTAANDRERANVPVLHLEQGAGGLDTLRRRYSQPLFVLLAMVGLILAIACANTANLLLARAAARRREIALRLSLGAGRFRIVRQLLTESTLLASLGGSLGILIALAGIGILTRLLANAQDGFTLDAAMNWHVLFVTMGLSLSCGVLFGVAPAIQSTRPALMPTIKDTGVIQSRTRTYRLSLTQALIVSQVALSLLLLVGAGLFVRTLANLQSIQLGFNRNNVLLFELNAYQAGLSESQAATFYAALRDRLSEIPGVRDATLSHASLIRAGRQLPISVNGTPARGTRILSTGRAFFTTMQIPIVRGREIDDRDRPGSLPVAVISDLFASTYFAGENPLGQRIRLGGRSPLDLEVVGVAASARYGGLKGEVPPVVYIPFAQITYPPLRQMTYALRTDGDPMQYVNTVRHIVRQANAHVPLTNVKTQATEIDQTINQEIIFARLCTAFAALALIIACVGLYAVTAFSVARRTTEIGLRMALGARRGNVVWMVLREVSVLAMLGLAISLPIALGTSRLIESFLFETKPNDPATLLFAVVILLSATLLAGAAPAQKASHINPMIALRQD